MNRRYFVLGLGIVLALALVVPALGGPSNPVATVSASAKKTANKALKAAIAAQSTADTAQSSANSAQSTANSAQGAAATAQTAANAAQTSANAANANANTRLSTTSTTTATSANNSADKSINAACPAGNVVTGGGFGLGGDDPTDVSADLSASYGDSWTASAHESDATASNWAITSYVICAT